MTRAPIADRIRADMAGRKPCYCGAELSIDTMRRLRAFARECIRNSGGDPDECLPFAEPVRDTGMGSGRVVMMEARA